FLRHFREAIQVEDLLANLVLICLDVAIRVDLLGPKVVHNLDGPFAEDILLKDIRQTRLRINGEYEYLLALLSKPIPCRRRKSSLTKPAFTTEHDVFALRDQFRQLSHLLIEVSAIGRATGSGEPRSARKLAPRGKPAAPRRQSLLRSPARSPLLPPPTPLRRAAPA